MKLNDNNWEIFHSYFVRNTRRPRQAMHFWYSSSKTSHTAYQRSHLSPTEQRIRPLWIVNRRTWISTPVLILTLESEWAIFAPAFKADIKNRRLHGDSILRQYASNTFSARSTGQPCHSTAVFHFRELQRQKITSNNKHTQAKQPKWPQFLFPCQSKRLQHLAEIVQRRRHVKEQCKFKRAKVN